MLLHASRLILQSLQYVRDESEVHVRTGGWCSQEQPLLSCCTVTSIHAEWSLLLPCGEKWIRWQIRKYKRAPKKTVFLILWFLTPTPSPRYLSFYVGRLPLPRLAPLRLTYFFFHFDHLSHLHKQFCFCDWSLSLMEAIGFFFYSSPSARMPMIRDPYIH